MVAAATGSACLGADFAQDGIARASFHHRDQHPGAPAAQYQVDFPIADAAFFFDDGRALVDADAVFNLASGIGFAIAFLAFFLTVPQMAIQRPARLTIRPDVLIDALGYSTEARRSPAADPQSARDSTLDADRLSMRSMTAGVIFVAFALARRRARACWWAWPGR